MNCIYCQQECKVVSLSDVATSLKTRCPACRALFLFDNTDENIMTIIWGETKIGNKYYCAKLYPGPTGNAPEFVTYHRHEYESSWEPRSWSVLFRWNFIPELWNPENFSTKMRTHIPFL